MKTDIPLPSRRYTCVACGSKGRRANKPEQRLQDPICPRCHANCDDLVRLMEWQASCLERNSTDTPRTDAASFSSRDPLELMKTSQQLEIELTHSLQNQVKTQAEVERLTKEGELYRAANADVKRIADERNKAEAEVKSLTEKLTSLQTAYLASAERDNSLTKELFDSRAEIESLSKLTEDCLNVIRVYCPIYYNDAMDRFKTINKCTH